jgi:hypothetical protein
MTATYGEERYFFLSRTGSTKTKGGASPVYTAFKQLENGEFIQVASRDQLEEAVQLVDLLNAAWPGEYEVRESDTKAVRYSLSCRLGGKSNQNLWFESISAWPERNAPQRN